MRSDRARGIGLALLCWLACSEAPAAEPLLARVVAVDAGQISLRPVGEARTGVAPIRLSVDGLDVPEGIVPGELVRYWPGDAAGGSAAVISLDRERGGVRDRTGVRARLMYGAERGVGGMRGGR
ncbi:MAG: hypothetical protein K9L70_00245 [Thiohalocapsa sp.]|nr:hypothetical protein [Thiohalocapsa sp.]MCF7989783.1 hypothetical protein [Thiohalocapsa sp.]